MGRSFKVLAMSASEERMKSAGTEAVAELRRCFPPEKVLPALYGCNGMVDIVTVRQAVEA